MATEPRLPPPILMTRTLCTYAHTYVSTVAFWVHVMVIETECDIEQLATRKGKSGLGLKGSLHGQEGDLVTVQCFLGQPTLCCYLSLLLLPLQSPMWPRTTVLAPYRAQYHCWSVFVIRICYPKSNHVIFLRSNAHCNHQHEVWMTVQFTWHS